MLAYWMPCPSHNWQRTEEGPRDVHIMPALYESARTGQPVQIDSTAPSVKSALSLTKRVTMPRREREEVNELATNHRPRVSDRQCAGVDCYCDRATQPRPRRLRRAP